MYHTEHDFAPVVANYIRNRGVADWEELRNLVVLEFALNDEDLVQLPGSAYPTRWQSQLNNLGANKTIIRTYSDIVRIRNGFATKEYANEHQLQIIDDGVSHSQPHRSRPQRNRMTRADVKKAIWTFYKSNKHRLHEEVKTHRNRIITAVLQQRPTTESVVQKLVADEMNKFAVV